MFPGSKLLTPCIVRICCELIANLTGLLTGRRFKAVIQFLTCWPAFNYTKQSGPM